ncbi:MAG: hypothetical protein JWN14_2725, partial [Chthonomonadales bacterium]|nr:hypothetical protein [Chthonomonadales bacterium]
MFKLFQSFFIFCAGADASQMRSADFSRDRARYAAAGVFVFLTAVLAAVFAGFALSTLTPNPKIYGSAAALWAIFIFCMDRQIVMSIRKTDRPIKQFIAAVPRLLIAACIGFAISKPVELFVFDREISTILHQNEENKQDVAQVQAVHRVESENAAINQEIESLRTANQVLTKQQNDIQTSEFQANQDVMTNKNNKSDQTHAQMVRDRLTEQNKPILCGIKTQLTSNADKIAADNAKLRPLPVLVHSVGRTQFGLLERLQALGDYARENQEGGFWLKFIAGFFVLLELTPVIVKLMSKAGPYDEFIVVSEKESIERINDTFEAFGRNKAVRIENMAAQELLLIKKQAEQMQLLVDSKELDRLLEKSRWSLAKALAESIARGLQDITNGLRASQSKLSTMHVSRLNDHVRKANDDLHVTDQIYQEKASNEVTKSKILSHAMLAKAKLNGLMDKFRRRND